MEKLFVTVLTTILCSASALFSQINADDKNQDNLANQGVLKQESYKHKYINNEPVETGVKTSETTFDNAGRVLTVISFYEKNGEIKTQESFKYNENGNKITYNKIEGGRIKFQRLYNYEGNNLIKESGINGGEKYENSYLYSNGKVSQITYRTDGITNEIRAFSYSGNQTFVSIKDPSGNIKSKLKIVRNSEDRVIEEITMDQGGNQMDRKAYTYGPNGKLMEETKFGPNDQLFYKNFYEYNSAGYITNFLEQTGSEAKFIKKIFEYDANNNLTLIKYRRNASEAYNEISYEYNEKGLRTTVVTYSPAYKFRLMNKYKYVFR